MNLLLHPHPFPQPLTKKITTTTTTTALTISASSARPIGPRPIPARDRVIDFGKHRGKQLGTLPSKYLKWVSNNLRARDFEEWARLADEVLSDPVYRDRVEWEFAQNVLNGDVLGKNQNSGAVSELLEISTRFGWDNEDKLGWSKIDFGLLGTSKGGRIPRVKKTSNFEFAVQSRGGDGMDEENERNFAYKTANFKKIAAQSRRGHDGMNEENKKIFAHKTANFEFSKSAVQSRKGGDGLNEENRRSFAYKSGNFENSKLAVQSRKGNDGMNEENIKKGGNFRNLKFAMESRKDSDGVNEENKRSSRTMNIGNFAVQKNGDGMEEENRRSFAYKSGNFENLQLSVKSRKGSDGMAEENRRSFDFRTGDGEMYEEIGKGEKDGRERRRERLRLQRRNGDYGSSVAEKLGNDGVTSGGIINENHSALENRSRFPGREALLNKALLLGRRKKI